MLAKRPLFTASVRRMTSGANCPNERLGGGIGVNVGAGNCETILTVATDGHGIIMLAIVPWIVCLRINSCQPFESRIVAWFDVIDPAAT